MNAQHSRQKRQAQNDIALMKGVVAFVVGMGILLLLALFGQ